MAHWLLDCQPLCGRPWRLGVGDESAEREQAYRLRHRVFFDEIGYRAGATGDRDHDEFDDRCDHIILVDTERAELLGTYRAIDGATGLYGDCQFDLAALDPIAAKILQGGRTCVAAEHRTGPAIQHLSYGMELLLRERGAAFLLGAESFRVEAPEQLDTIRSYLRAFGADSEWYAPARSVTQIDSLKIVPVTAADERALPSIIRMDLRMGFLVCSPPAWDADFGCYDARPQRREDVRLADVTHRRIAAGSPGLLLPLSVGQNLPRLLARMRASHRRCDPRRPGDHGHPPRTGYRQRRRHRATAGLLRCDPRDRWAPPAHADPR